MYVNSILALIDGSRLVSWDCERFDSWLIDGLSLCCKGNDVPLPTSCGVDL